MLVITRRLGESIRVGDDIVIHVMQADAPRARIGVDAPKEMTILRAELTQHGEQDIDQPGLLQQD